MLYLSGITKELFETHRGLIGQGHAQTHAILHRIVDYQVKGVPCGSWVYDWQIPPAWYVKEAWVAEVTEDCKLRIIIRNHNPLHLVAHSVPINKIVDFEELDKHLHVGGLSWIPHRTAYYHPVWGFCLTSKQYAQLDRSVNYHVFIDSSFDHEGVMVYGERTVGHGGERYLINTYDCHSGMYNDNVSGMVVWALLLRYLEEKESKLRNTYTFVIAPETIGILAWLHENEALAYDTVGAYTVAYCAGVGDFVYETTHQEVGEMDMAMILGNPGLATRPWSVDGSNGRQLASPGFNIPTGMLNRPAIYDSKYHTSMDGLSDYSYHSIMEALKKHANAIGVLENDRIYSRTEPHGEPMLGRHGLYGNVGGNNQDEYATYKWIAHNCHTYSLAEMAWVTEIPFADLLRAAKKMERAGILRCVER